VRGLSSGQRTHRPASSAGSGGGPSFDHLVRARRGSGVFPFGWATCARDETMEPGRPSNGHADVVGCGRAAGGYASLPSLRTRCSCDALPVGVLRQLGRKIGRCLRGHALVALPWGCARDLGLDAFHDEHVRDGGAQTSREGGLVFGRVLPAFCLINARELNYYESTRPRVPFKDLDPASPNDILAAIL